MPFQELPLAYVNLSTFTLNLQGEGTVVTEKLDSQLGLIYTTICVWVGGGHYVH